MVKTKTIGGYCYAERVQTHTGIEKRDTYAHRARKDATGNRRAAGLQPKTNKGFIRRYHRKQRKLEAGIALHKKGRLPKDCVATEQYKAAELKYALSRKEAKIKQLAMENERMRDFLSLAGGK